MQLPVNDTTDELFEWTPEKERIVTLLAEGELTDREIVQQFSIHIRTLYRWKNVPVFALRVEEEKRALGDLALRYAIGKRERRIKNLNDRLERMHQVIRDRAAEPEMADVPGGPTGLMVRTKKGIGAGENLQIFDEYAVDTGLLKELREHEKQAAIECGQWAERREMTGPNGGPVPVTFIEIGASDARPAVDRSSEQGK